MKIHIPTKTSSVPAELLAALQCKSEIEEKPWSGQPALWYKLRLVATLYKDMNRTKTHSRYCKTCGCEPYAEFATPLYWVSTTTGYSFTNDQEWKKGAEKALTPYIACEKLFKQFDKEVQEEQSRFFKMPCPVCGGELTYGKQDQAEAYECLKKSEAFAATCDIPVQVEIKEDAVESIKSSREKLREYLLHLIRVEKNIRAVKLSLFPLFMLSNEVNRQAKFAQLYPTMSQKEEANKKLSAMQSMLSEKQAELESLKKHRNAVASRGVISPVVQLPSKPSVPQEPTLEKPSFFNKKRVTAENEEKINAYNLAKKQYEKALLDYPVLLAQAEKRKEELYQAAQSKYSGMLESLDDEIRQKSNACIAYSNELAKAQEQIAKDIELLANKTDYPAVQLKIAVDKEIADAEEILKDLYKKKYQLYGADIIFRKYRDLAAISSFYEYLECGRCETLDGVNGCYNLYETELRANRIINQLEQIEASLERIKDNQYMLYSQLNDINIELTALHATTIGILQTMQATSESLLEHSSIIAHNSAVAAYYAKVNAEIASSSRYIRVICW